MKLLLLLCSAMMLSADQFAEYWYAGKAEVAVYDLQQSRYGLQRAGTATLIFVTEPFSAKKHVKLDSPALAGDDHLTALKLNRVKKYNTGIYPYSIMTSAFANVSNGELLKVNTTIQEWCGHVFLQANQTKPAHYNYRGYSYFESEGDDEGTLSNTELAESLLLKIRLGKLGTPSSLVPPQELSRTLHFPLQKCQASYSTSTDDQNTTLTITYNHPLKISTSITYSSSFPHVIQGWSESYSKNGHTFTTTATLKSVQRLPYWSMNSPEFNSMRKAIGLE